MVCKTCQPCKNKDKSNVSDIFESWMILKGLKIPSFAFLKWKKSFLKKMWILLKKFLMWLAHKMT